MRYFDLVNMVVYTFIMDVRYFGDQFLTTYDRPFHHFRFGILAESFPHTHY